MRRIFGLKTETKDGKIDVCWNAAMLCAVNYRIHAEGICLPELIRREYVIRKIMVEASFFFTQEHLPMLEPLVDDAQIDRLLDDAQDFAHPLLSDMCIQAGKPEWIKHIRKIRHQRP
jgi:hypothetical protein